MGGFIGVLSLEARFPRIRGDAGNPGSYHLPARVRVIGGADSPKIVRDGAPEPALAARFIDAARELEAEGAVLITSTCGFLVTMQAEIAQSVRVPVLLSGLSLVPVVRAMTGGRPVGVLTACAAKLGPRSLAAAGIAGGDVRIGGLEQDPVFAGVFLAPLAAQQASFDEAQMADVVMQAGRDLLARAPEIGAVVLECGNLPPYAAALRREIGRPVFSVLDGVRMIGG
ncbi:aspartate/glutamate racemase family protein [Paracoccus sp. SCSIO 75233]|uniref:aspartate/glutamate racemase family protein n=1 Tax=Paracoccus sp. SCSIO 75233 TaxID=3017782 RepID=UPI0022F101E9|nr:aspartate/glutamate racemase family protein [Paracoccus sp. SCSIO 75233]WBU53817.1 aspartate/glutamate racemase family protein [Paracoccus sp. SCSIO 75233]